MLGKIVSIKIERPIRSNHLDGAYGYSEDGKMGAYVLGVVEQVNIFTGEVIAIIHRKNEESQLVVAHQMFSKEEIYQIILEKPCDTFSIEMKETTYDDILFDLKRSGLTSKDVVLFHSSLKSFGKVDGKDIIRAFMDYFKEGLIIFPTHTWAYLKEDGMVFDALNTPSCVGTLTNLALQMEGFERSMHPTHSVCAYGAHKEAYLAHDLDAKTPVSLNGCFGVLKDMGAKIVFLGAPLSKNTFIHSIEEEMQVPDRFTDHIYHFISVKENQRLEYDMPRHYSTKSPHISDHYEKLYAHMIHKNIAYNTYIGNSKTVVIDAQKCYVYVKDLLKKNLYLFDDFKDFDD